MASPAESTSTRVESRAAAGSANPYGMSTWKGEFVDPATEGRYRRHTEHAASRFLRNALILWAALWMAFAFTDYQQFGLGAEFFEALAVRGVLVVFIVAGALLVHRWPHLATSGVVVTPLALLGFTAFFGLYFVSPAESIPWLVSVTMIMVVGLFVLLPNRIVLSTVVATYAIVGTLVSVALAVPETTVLRMTVLGQILLLPSVTGLFAAYRFEVVRRREFAALEQARAEIDRRKALEAELQQQASSDPLTGVCNRREYERLFSIEGERARRHNRPLAVCILDLDHFKHVNDTYGHNAGDVALTLTADICRTELRDADIMGRLGGEEFVFILPDTSAADAAAVAERLRTRLERTDVVAAQQRFRLTGTFGVTELTRRDRNIQDLILRADEALYEGKRSGRNRVCAA